jgi:hypothetical protein
MKVDAGIELPDGALGPDPWDDALRGIPSARPHNLS